MADLSAKAKRVFGTSIVMIGAGAVVDCHAVAIGTAVMLAGGTALVWGLLEPRLRSRSRPDDVPVVKRRSTESLG